MKKRRGTKAHRDQATKLIRSMRKHPSWKKLPPSHRKAMVKFAKGE